MKGIRKGALGADDALSRVRGVPYLKLGGRWVSIHSAGERARKTDAKCLQLLSTLTTLAALVL